MSSFLTPIRSTPESNNVFTESFEKVKNTIGSLFSKPKQKSSSSENAETKTCEDIPLRESSRATILRKYFETKAKKEPTLLEGFGLGIQNQANSCAIACILFNICSMYGYREHFDEFLAFSEEDTEDARTLKFALMDLVSHLDSPYERGMVPGFKLENIRNIVMPEDTKKAVFLDPDEFITSFFDKLNIPFGKSLVKISPTQEQIPNTKKTTSIQTIINTILKENSKAEESETIIDEKNTKILFIQMPRQGCEDTKIDHIKNYGNVWPSPQIEIGSTRFKLQSYLVNVNRNHYISYVYYEKFDQLYIFDSNAAEIDDEIAPAIHQAYGLSRIFLKKNSLRGLVAQNPKLFSGLEFHYKRSVKNLAYLTYVRDDEK
ncbi:MAG: hypothetical protein K1060chlam4_01183 [Candidatus Anoxychlamydiales bacterium]|nr:hypothetical protein [Candidatus Anoxychlamydiales bacterium]NGX53221.1 hypothetical protein [Candidatus Anoxychlamydiales bacterium]